MRARLRPLEPEPNPVALNAELTLSDTEMLLLLEHIVLDYAADEEASRTRYAAAIAGVADAPTFDVLRQDGWFQILLGRVVTPINISVAASHATSVSPGLPALISQRFAVDHDFSAVPRGVKAVDDAIAGLTTQYLRFLDIECRTPEWVAARLWERRPTMGDALRWWLDRWDLLGQPLFSPTEAWEGNEAQAFVHLVLDRLEAEPALVGWPDIRQAVADQSMRMARQVGLGSLDLIPAIPDTVIGRARWLGDPLLGEVPRMRAETFEEVRLLIDLITGDIERRRYSAAPDDQFVRLTGIALERPDLKYVLIHRALRHALLVAEFLVQPATCALGCWLLTLRSLGQMSTAEDPQAREYALAALQQSLALLQRFLEEETTGGVPAEAAALLEAAFDTTGRPRRLGSLIEAETMVLGALQQLGARAVPIVEALAGAAAPDSLDAPSFVAGLELVAAATLEDAIAPNPLPDMYICAVRTGDRQLSADRVSSERAAALFRLAKRCGVPFLMKFLYPFDWRSALAALDDEKFEERQKIVRSIEAATRYLAAAVSGLAGETHSELVDALAAHVSAGSEDDWANGKVWAFASRRLRLPWLSAAEVTMGSLLGDALFALDKPSREKLLIACLELREPAVLANLYSAAPRDCRARILARIDAIGTDRAISIYSLDTINLRIDALLDAGLTAAAERHIKDTRDATTMGKVTERPRIEFNHDMRLLFQKGDWQAIAAAKVPAGLPQIERKICGRILTSFQAIALLQDVNANPHAAVARLERLATDNPAELGHQVNLFAAKASARLGPASFPNLVLSEKRAARQLIAEIETWMATTVGVTPRDRDICASNLAPLDLSIGDPRRALERLQSLPADTESAPRMAYMAIAQARLDRGNDAHIILDRAFELFGDNALLVAARAHLVGDQSAGGLGATDRLIFTPAPEEMRHLRDAMARFRNAPSRDKAAVLREGPEALPALVIDYVDNALAGVSNLAPLLKRGTLRDDEDDITAILKQLLNGALHFLGFSTPDQCKGGYTPNGNYGERDLIIVDGNTELAIMEAVIADGSVPKEELVKHFRKMLGYGDCPLYVHLTYAWLNDTTRLIKVLQSIATDEAPSDHAFEGMEVRTRAGNEPDGFTVRYRVRGQVIQVVFRVLDLGQERLRHAAASSAQPANVPSRKPRAKKTSPVGL
ncbi:hypothetical protein GCM10019071_34750 [Sphingobium fuliginis]|uniref:Uncharacterized protein n=1 Tax=Sphingobium fuliginis (strain ATCC 27551) TaxID=336203 RepID=A0ABQ1F7Z2_SPHSA|nr:hypothetical protein GCM10019071_34750 [Sphingobium fuliginis]